MKRFFFLTMSFLSIASLVNSDEPTREGIWLQQRDNEFGIIIQTAELTLTPKGEAKPALKYRLIPDDFDCVCERKRKSEPRYGKSPSQGTLFSVRWLAF